MIKTQHRVYLSAWFKLTYYSVGPAAQNATVDELRKALLNGGTILDVRNADEREVGTDGIFTMFEGTISAQYDRSTDTLPIKCLPENVGKYKNELMFYVASLTSSLFFFLFFFHLFLSCPCVLLQHRCTSHCSLPVRWTCTNGGFQIKKIQKSIVLRIS
jgi:hypothetical protein